MGLLSIAVKQREKEEKALRSFLAFSLIGSVALHIAVLVLSSLWFRTPELAEEPIEVIVVDPPSFQAAKPKEKTKSAAPPNLQAAKQEEKTKSKGGSVAKGGSNSGSGTKSQGGSGAAGGSSIDGGSRVGETAGNPSTLPSQPMASTTESVKRDAIASIAPSEPPIISEQQPKPVETTTTRAPVETLKPKLEPTPKPAETLPPVPTLPPLPPTPKPAATLPPEQASTQPLSTPSPSLTPTLEPKLTSQPTPVPVAQSPSPPAAPTQPPPARQQVAKKVRDLFREQTNSTSQEIAGNGARQSDNLRGVGDRSSVAAGSGNRQSSGSTRGSGTRDSGQSTGGNGSGSGSGTGGNGSGSGSGTGGNGSGSGSGTGGNGSGSGRVACRSCPKPEYPPGAEKLEGRAVVLVNVDRRGNVSDVQIAKSTGHSILDQRALETVKKKWKFTSSENGERVKAAVNFATQGSEFYRQARERESQARQRERQAREREQQRKRERQAREEQQRKRERQAREEQQRERELLNRETPAPVPETRETPTTPTAPMPEATTIPQASPNL